MTLLRRLVVALCLLGVIAFLGTAGYVVALKRDGALLWTLDLEGSVAEALALGADQTLYVQTESTILAIGE